MSNLPVEFFLECLAFVQAISIVIGSVIVLQGVLQRHSTSLRLSFITFPIGASLEIIEMLMGDSGDINHAITLVVLNTAIIVTISWLWRQRNMIADIEKVLANEAKMDTYSFSVELKSIITCLAIWVIRGINHDDSARVAVCSQINPRVKKSRKGDIV